MSVVVILDPSCSYRVVEAAFLEDGWSGGPVTALAPLVPGEPEAATWRREGFAVRYTCDPVMWFRLLRSDADVQLPDLPRVTVDEVDVLLGSEIDADQLLGIRAVEVLEARQLLAHLDRLMLTTSPIVSAEARRVHGDLLGGASGH
jgi:hypothetical protein